MHRAGDTRSNLSALAAFLGYFVHDLVASRAEWSSYVCVRIVGEAFGPSSYESALQPLDVVHHLIAMALIVGCLGTWLKAENALPSQCSVLQLREHFSRRFPISC